MRPGRIIALVGSATFVVACGDVASRPFTPVHHDAGPGDHVAAGYADTCALLASGAVDCWGEDGSDVPVPVFQLQGATMITAGEAHACAAFLFEGASCWAGANATTIPQWVIWP